MTSQITDTTQPLSSAGCAETVKALCGRYSFLWQGGIGRSARGRELCAVRLGRGEKKVLFVGAHHGLEWITSLVLLRFLEELCGSYEKGEKLAGHDLNYLFQTRSIFFVPMLNPDGVDRSQSGEAGTEAWQSNARGVDLNHNYDALWAQGKALEPQAGVFGPGPTRFGGLFPESERETAALCALCRGVPFSLALALHSQGEEIYYDFGENTPKNALAMAEILATVSGYTVARPQGIAAFGGFKDWFIQSFSRPAFTVELGRGENPLPLSGFESGYLPCRALLFTAALL